MKCACTYIGQNLFEDMAQLQPWPHSLAYCSRGEGHLHRGWICAPKLCHRRCAHLHIATAPKSTPDNTSQASPIIYLQEVVYDWKFFYFSAVAKLWFAKHVWNCERGSMSPYDGSSDHVVMPCFIFFNLHTLFSCIKKIVHSCGYVRVGP